MKKKGRPSNYDPKLVDKMIEFFNRPLYRMVKKVVVSRGVPVEIEVEEANSLPTFEGFGRQHRITAKTLLKYADEHEAFGKAYTLCKDIQKDFIIEHGLRGNFNPGFAKFVAMNVTDMRDKSAEAIEELNNLIQLKYNLEK